jgi:hypothetical protein
MLEAIGEHRASEDCLLCDLVEEALHFFDGVEPSNTMRDDQAAELRDGKEEDVTFSAM